MNYTRRFSGITAALLLVVTGSLGAVGCGGGGSGSSTDSIVPVTRDTESQYSTEALIIAAQRKTGNMVSNNELVSSVTVREVERDLATTRDRYPALADIDIYGHAQDLRSLSLSTEPGSPVGQAWQQGQTLTGVAKVDELLKRYELDSVLPLSNNGAGFILHFKRLLNVERVRYNLTLAANQDGMNIYPLTPAPPAYSYHLGLMGSTYISRTDSNAGREYSFIRGYGDCPSGCMQSHTRTVTIKRDGTLTVKETGAPPNGNYR